MFGLVVPGRPCFGDFAQVAENRWFAQIPDKINNQSISEVTLFILPGAGASIPPQIGFTIYISKDSQNWEYLDFLSAEKQSTHAHMPLSFGSSSSSASLFQGFAQQQQTDQSFIFPRICPTATANRSILHLYRNIRRIDGHHQQPLRQCTKQTTNGAQPSPTTCSIHRQGSLQFHVELYQTHSIPTGHDEGHVDLTNELY